MGPKKASASGGEKKKRMITIETKLFSEEKATMTTAKIKEMLANYYKVVDFIEKKTSRKGAHKLFLGIVRRHLLKSL